MSSSSVCKKAITHTTYQEHYCLPHSEKKPFLFPLKTLNCSQDQTFVPFLKVMEKKKGSPPHSHPKTVLLSLLPETKRISQQECERNPPFSTIIKRKKGVKISVFSQHTGVDKRYLANNIKTTLQIILNVGINICSISQ